MQRFADARTRGERRFNAIADEIRARVKTGKHGEDTMDRVYSMIEAMSFRFAAPRLYSVEHSFWSFTGGAHGNGGTQNFNFDPVTGKDYTVDDFFPEDAVVKLIASCKDKIIAEKKSRWGSEPYDPAQDFFMQDGVIGEHVATFSRWSFNAEGASVNFDSYAIGSYADRTQGAGAARLAPAVIRNIVNRSETQEAQHGANHEARHACRSVARPGRACLFAELPRIPDGPRRRDIALQHRRRGARRDQP
jgi:hypothetical protein